MDFRHSSDRPLASFGGNSREVKLWIKTAGSPAAGPGSAFWGEGWATPDYNLSRKALSTGLYLSVKLF
jgi:hypothetical protein